MNRNDPCPKVAQILNLLIIMRKSNIINIQNRTPNNKKSIIQIKTILSDKILKNTNLISSQELIDH
ncbi:hypothetical protein BpHYR1_016255 [Brachionus plicatilis]|uniref:Uncharacterized protein n=1 Tax=Brachionus plicatilis TaxID=10195 RepID=A0A3M7RIM2_BRAPC|nr:hypothetical protein BpHYR1_016255 [Brachionus plicatilis]